MHVTTGLENGGAEAALYRLIVNDRADTHAVISLSTLGVYGPRLADRGIAVEALGMRPDRPSPGALVRLARRIRARRPEAVQTWMYHANVFGGVAARLAGVKRVHWGIHHATLGASTKRRTRLVVRAGTLLSRVVPSTVVSCSKTAAAVHQRLGYPAAKMRVVANGYDLTEFAPDPQLRRATREALGLPEDAFVLGMVARVTPEKDHPNLLRALAALKARGARFACLLVGPGATLENAALARAVAEAGVTKEVLALGPRDDVPAIMNAIDLHALSSNSEAFPNVLAEAMACGTPCVATDVGDCAFIVGDTGWLAPPSDPQALAAAIEAAVREGPARRSEAAIARVRAMFSIERMVDGYRAVWSG